jgi:hypothetical protein
MESGGTSRFVPPEPEELAGCFPDLEILECIGRGGMGCVYKARQRHLDRLVALKILPSELGNDPAFAERFAREARTLARLAHPNIVIIHDFGQACGMYYLVMEYMDGMNLRELMQAGGVSPAETLKIVPQLCSALQYAHDEGVVHRDIKPENILFDRRGHVKLADFGLVKLVTRTDLDVSLTASRQAMGTPYYMAPEHWKGSHHVDHRADIYGLGVVFYEMLTGELPLGRFDPPSQKASVDPRLDEVVMRSMQSNPANRYQQAKELGRDIERITRTANDPLRIVPELPHRFRMLAPAAVEFMSTALGEAATFLRIAAHFLKRFLVSFPWATAVACGLVITLTNLPWLGYAGGYHGTTGTDTWIVVNGIQVENFWPAVAVGLVGFLTLFRPLLGFRSELLSIGLCAYGIAHVALFYTAGEYGRHWDPIVIRDAVQLTASPLIIGITFAVLMLGNLWSLFRRIVQSMKGERNMRSMLRSVYRMAIHDDTLM